MEHMLTSAVKHVTFGAAEESITWDNLESLSYCGDHPVGVGDNESFNRATLHSRTKLILARSQNACLVETQEMDPGHAGGGGMLLPAGHFQVQLLVHCGDVSA
jgi:hypothetical protein